MMYPLAQAAPEWESIDNAFSAVPHPRIRIGHFSQRPFGLVVCADGFPVMYDPHWHGRGTYTYQVITLPSGNVQLTRNSQSVDIVHVGGGIGSCPITDSTPTGLLGGVSALVVAVTGASQMNGMIPPMPVADLYPHHTWIIQHLPHGHTPGQPTTAEECVASCPSCAHHMWNTGTGECQTLPAPCGLHHTGKMSPWLTYTPTTPPVSATIAALVSDVPDREGIRWPLHLDKITIGATNLSNPPQGQTRSIEKGERFITWATSVCVSVEIHPCALLENVAIVLARAEDAGHSGIEIIVHPSGAGPGRYIECATNANATGRTEFIGPRAPSTGNRGCTRFHTMQVWRPTEEAPTIHNQPIPSPSTFALLPNSSINTAACSNTYDCVANSSSACLFACTTGQGPAWIGPASPNESPMCHLDETPEDQANSMILMQQGLSQQLCDTHYTAWQTSEINVPCGPCDTLDVPFPLPQHTRLQARTGTRKNPSQAIVTQTRAFGARNWSWAHCNTSRVITASCNVTCPTDCLFDNHVANRTVIRQPECHEQGRSNAWEDTATRVQFHRKISTYGDTNNGGLSCTVQKQRQLDAFYETGLSGWCTRAPRLHDSVEAFDKLTLLIRPLLDTLPLSTVPDLAPRICDKAAQQLTYCSTNDDPSLFIALLLSWSSILVSTTIYMMILVIPLVIDKILF